MATTTTIGATASAYGYSGAGNFTQTNGTHIYAGKDSATYRSRLRFPSLKSIAEIGENTIKISSIIFYLSRNDGDGGTRYITAGCTTDSAWGAARYGVSQGRIGSSDGVYSMDITACADYIKDYDGNWFLHIYSDSARTRFYACHGSTKYVPRIAVTWEYVANTIKTETDRATLGEGVTFNFTPQEGDASYTLNYSIGDTSGTIASNITDTSITWVPPESIANELPDTEEGQVTVTMTVYDADGNVRRTELLYLTIDVAPSALPAISDIGIEVLDGLNGYVLTGKSSLKIIPTIDMNSAYSATIKNVTATITNGESQQIIEYSTVTEGEPGIYACEPETTNIIGTAGDITIDLAVTDSRGRTVTDQRVLQAHAYTFPAIKTFSIDRYEPVYDDNEEIVGYEVSDVGEYVFVTIDAQVADMTPAGESINFASWEIETATAGVSVAGIYTGGGTATTIVITQDRGIITDVVPATEEIDFTLTVRDSSGSVAYAYDSVAPGRANFALSGTKYGAAFGGLPKGTKDNPMLESFYPFHAYEPIHAHAGVEGIGITYPMHNDLSNYMDYTTGEEQFTGDYWLDGKPIYRRSGTGYLGTTDDINFSSIGPVESVVKMYGFAEWPGSWRIPVNSYPTSGMNFACWVEDANGTLRGHVNPKGATVLVVVEYTKP